MRIDSLLNAPSLFSEKIDIDVHVFTIKLSSKSSAATNKKSRHSSLNQRKILSTAITAPETAAKKPKVMHYATRSISEQ